VKILLVEDHPIVRAGCQRLLHNRPDTQVVEASTAAEALRSQSECRPDVIVLDLKLPDANGLDVLRQMLARDADAKVVVFSMYEDRVFVASALDAGAVGYISKNDDPASLSEALDRISAGEIFLGRTVAQKLALMKLDSAEASRTVLTRRETEVVALLGEGKSLAEIAGDLGISYRTAAATSAKLKAKLGLSTMSALVRFAVERRQAEPPWGNQALVE
jgi:two-component system, NarL family, invasion response regulator UvrY